MTNNTLTLRSVDIPSINKFGIGFESIIDELLRATAQQQTNYPPYNIIRNDEDHFTIEVAVAGFKQGEVDVTVEKNILTISGSKKDPTPENVEYLHRGISARNFVRNWTLAEHVEIVGAIMRDGILVLDLERQVPEDQKPKSIAITYIK
jgi:molecular chaperone IbpA